jgi:hypothetical protein
VGRDQVLYLLSEDLAQKTGEVMADVFRFLGVSDRSDAEARDRQHAATVPRSMRLTRAVKSKGLHKNLLRLLVPFPAMRRKLRQGVLDWNQTGDIDITLGEKTRERLKALFREENGKLATLIGRDLGHWS